MIHIDITWPTEADCAHLLAEIDRWAFDAGLECGLDGTLAKYPGSLHRHYRRPLEAGTLEVTIQDEQRRLWISIQHRRQADWISSACELLQGRLNALRNTFNG